MAIDRLLHAGLQSLTAGKLVRQQAASQGRRSSGGSSGGDSDGSSPSGSLSDMISRAALDYMQPEDDQEWEDIRSHKDEKKKEELFKCADGWSKLLSIKIFEANTYAQIHVTCIAFGPMHVAEHNMLQVCT